MWDVALKNGYRYYNGRGGGAVYVAANGTFTATSSTFSGNYAVRSMHDDKHDGTWKDAVYIGPEGGGKLGVHWTGEGDGGSTARKARTSSSRARVSGA